MCKLSYSYALYFFAMCLSTRACVLHACVLFVLCNEYRARGHVLLTHRGTFFCVLVCGIACSYVCACVWHCMFVRLCDV